MKIKGDINQALEKPRAEGKIGSSLEANIMLRPLDNVVKNYLAKIDPSELATLFVVSQVSLSDSVPTDPLIGEMTEAQGVDVAVYAVKSQDEKCVRCWKYLPSVGASTVHPQLCAPCVQAVDAVLQSI